MKTKNDLNLLENFITDLLEKDQKEIEQRNIVKILGLHHQFIDNYLNSLEDMYMIKLSVLEWLDAFIPLIAVVIVSAITVVFVERYNHKKEKNKMKANIIEELSLLIEMNNRLILMFENLDNPIAIEDESTDFLSKMYIIFHKMSAYLGIKESKLLQAGINLDDIEENLEFMRGKKRKPEIILNLFKSIGKIFDLIHES